MKSHLGLVRQLQRLADPVQRRELRPQSEVDGRAEVLGRHLANQLAGRGRRGAVLLLVDGRNDDRLCGAGGPCVGVPSRFRCSLTSRIG